MTGVVKLIKDIIMEALHLFREMAPYILLGAMLAGLLHVLLKREWVARHTGRGLKAVWLSALFGVPLPLCSCGVVPAARYMKKAGSSPAAVISFLISTPQTGIDSLIATGGLLGPFMAVYRGLAAFFSGILGGTLSYFTGGKNGEPDPTEKDPPAVEKIPPGKKIRELFSYALLETMEDLALPLAVGLLIAAVLGVVIPADFLTGTPFAEGLPAMLLMGLLGIPMYVCSTSSIPVAMVLMAKGISPGAAFVFLMTGPATNAASIAVFLKTLGRKQTLIYLAAIFGTALLSGFLLDALLPLLPSGWQPLTGTGPAGKGSLWIVIAETILSVILAGLLLYQLIKKVIPQKKKPCSCQASAETSE
jgi:uncharacterized membrane protein YraQ (UPF0718 family)